MVSYALSKVKKEHTTGMCKVRYSQEMKEQTVKYILEVGKTASKAAVELGIAFRLKKLDIKYY